MALAVIWRAVLLRVWVDWQREIQYLSETTATMLSRQLRNLQCGPALVQPLVLSPKAWMCMPRLALASLPVMSYEIVVSEPSDDCSKVTVPLTLESPRRTATEIRISFC